ncbi:MAG: amidohydrolase family protein [Gammaproteobacteria bacterium]
MPAVLADLSIEARWIVPMSMPGRVLENHTLVVRDGRILDLLPSADAVLRYAATARVPRPQHLLMPGMVNAATHAAMTLFRGTPTGAVSPLAASYEPRPIGAEFVRVGVLVAIAEMLTSGVTSFADRYYFPEVTARTAGEQGMRAVIGMPVTETSNPWAASAADCLTKSLSVRDEYKGHPLISTIFAPHGPNSLSDADFTRIATLSDELDAGIMIDLHESAAEIAASIARYGMRPIERLWQLGLLTPSLNAVHMAHATAADAALAQRTGIAITLCPQSNLKQAGVLPPAATFAASAIRLGLGSGGGTPCQNLGIWGEMKLLAQMCCAGQAPLSAWDALAMATRGGAAVLGLDADVGTLEPGRWADLCCVDLGGPATQPVGDPVTQLVFCGSRDMVSDVWVAGRQLLADGELTRLDWRAAAERAGAWAVRLNTGE